MFRKDDGQYFDNLINNLKVYPNQICYLNGEMKRVHEQNVFAALKNEITWLPKRKKLFVAYINNRFGSPDLFNKWCRSREIFLIAPTQKTLNFYDDPEFNLVFVKNKKYLDCYIKEDNCFQLSYFTSSNSKNFFNEVIYYLGMVRNLHSIADTAEDKQIINALKLELRQGYHLIDSPIKLISNDANTPCYGYFDLKRLKAGDTEAWDMFTYQLSTVRDEELFKAWIYSIFVEDDYNRQILWVEGSGYNGKSTIASVIGQFLNKKNDGLFKAIADKEKTRTDQFSMAGFDKCRLGVFSDSKENDIFQRPEILNLTGGDYITIREPFKAPETKRVQVKVMVNSNISPTVNRNAVYQTTRMLHVVMAQDKSEEIRKLWHKTTGSYELRLMKQLPAFLRKCQKSYRDCKQKDGLLKA